MQSFGIMQGRLTPSKGRGIQFFPFDHWQEEFRIGKELGIREIEWIFDYEQYEQNPLWTPEGVEQIRRICSETGVRIRSVCFDYFMRRPFFKAQDEQRNELRKENLRFIETVLQGISGIGATLLEIPLVDDSSMKDENEKEAVRVFVREVVAMGKQRGIKISLETDLPPVIFKEYLDSIESEIYANYDSGNSSGLGYQHDLEITSLGAYIANVHIKDRKLHGTTMKLGTGSADFDQVFSALKEIGYDKSIILQAARGEDGLEAENIGNQLVFVKDYCGKYAL